MPSTAWDGYHRFCPLARALDVLGDRWTMVVLHELMGGPLRYGDLKEHLPGIGSNVLSERLKRLEAAGLTPSLSFVRNEWLGARPAGTGVSIKQEPEASLSSRPIFGHLAFTSSTSASGFCSPSR